MQPSILLVDDQEKNLALLEAILSNLNVALLRTTDGQEAIEMARETEPALVLLDVQMPVLNGFEVARKLRDIAGYRHVPIIFITAFGADHTRHFEGYDSGAVDYLVKPIEPRMLRAKVRVFLELYNKRRQVERQAEELARAAQRLKEQTAVLEQSNIALRQFAYVASHDLQTPLRSVVSFAQLLQRRYQDTIDERGEKYIERITKAALRMNTLIQDLLIYSRIESEALLHESVDLNEIVEEAKELIADTIEQSGGQITYDPLPVIFGIPSMLCQLLQNLLNNGLKYHREEAPRVHVSADKSEQEWTIRIQDNGIGIAEEYHDQIFEIFKRLHSHETYQGTGIGLAVCRRIVHRHRGKLWLTSEVGKGSCFSFTIPRRDDTIHWPQQSDSKSALPPQNPAPQAPPRKEPAPTPPATPTPAATTKPLSERPLSELSHKLRTTLNTITGYTGILLMRLPGPLNDAQEEQLMEVESHANLLLELLDEVMGRLIAESEERSSQSPQN